MVSFVAHAEVFRESVQCAQFQLLGVDFLARILPHSLSGLPLGVRQAWLHLLVTLLEHLFYNDLFLALEVHVMLHFYDGSRHEHFGLGERVSQVPTLVELGLRAVCHLAKLFIGIFPSELLAQSLLAGFVRRICRQASDALTPHCLVDWQGELDQVLPLGSRQ